MKFVQSTTRQDRLVSELRTELQHQAEGWSKVLASDVLVSPTLRNDQILLRRPKTWRQYLRLLMVHWYLPEEIRPLVHLELEELENKYGIDKNIVAHTILESEPKMILYILESNLFKTERELFGFVHMHFQFEKYHFFVLRARKPRRLVRRRGYKDHGSRRLPHEQHEAKFDYSFTEEQNRIEAERQANIDAQDIVSGFLD